MLVRLETLRTVRRQFSVLDLTEITLEGPLVLRVSDAGGEGSCQVSIGRRPKAAKERTRGRLCGGRAAHSAMGICVRMKVRSMDRNGLKDER